MSEKDIFEAIKQALVYHGVEVVAEFRVPGTKHIIDLYVPCVPRAAIEVGASLSLDTIKKLDDLQLAFAGRLVIFFISFGTEPTQDIIQKLKEIKYTHHLALPAIQSKNALNEITLDYAKEISDVLAGIAKTRFGFSQKSAEEPQSVRVPRPYGASPQAEVLLRKGDSGELGPTRTTDSLLRTLKGLLPQESYAVIQHELTQLESEFCQHHFTSCALRAGRSLELVVYVLAKAWGVRLDEQVFNLTEELQQRVQALNSAILQYKDAETSDRQEKRASIQRLGSDFAARISSLGFLLDDRKLQSITTPPRNVEAIIRDVRKTFSRYEVVRTEVKEILDGGLLRNILSVRNRAAHADLSGRPREITKNTVLDMVQHVQTLLHKLSLIGDVIAEARTKQG